MEEATLEQLEDIDTTQEGFDTTVEDDCSDEVRNAIPLYLRDISSLASWTVSSHKPGCGVAALRHPSNAFYWQSDGPQPHTLNIHFFKLVSIAYMRIFLDCRLDESYTPTRMTILAGTGHHDLQQVCEMSLQEPRGWIDIDLRNAGGPDIFEDIGLEPSMAEQLVHEMDEAGYARDLSPNCRQDLTTIMSKGFGPTLRCFLVQIKISENHQNGKDTHLRGLQIFARDLSLLRRFQTAASIAYKRASLPAMTAQDLPAFDASPARRAQHATHALAMRQSSWMDEPAIR